MSKFSRHIKRRHREQIRVELSHWMDSDMLNIRVWVETDAGYVATKSGFTIPLDGRALSFCEAVVEAIQEAQKRGLIT